MFNLSVKQVHNLLRSTYCHWQGPAIARNSCFGNQLIWAGGERLLGPAGREQLEDVSWMWAAFLLLYQAIWVLIPEPALPACSPHSSLPQRVLQDVLALSALPTRSSSFASCQDTQGALSQVAPESVHQRLRNFLPAPLGCSFSRSVCQGQLSSSLTELLVSWKGATALAKDLVAAPCEIPWRFHQQESLGRKIGGKEMEKGKGGPDGTECYQFQSWFEIFSWG